MKKTKIDKYTKPNQDSGNTEYTYCFPIQWEKGTPGVSEPFPTPIL